MAVRNLRGFTACSAICDLPAVIAFPGFVAQIEMRRPGVIRDATLTKLRSPSLQAARYHIRAFSRLRGTFWVKWLSSANSQWPSGTIS